MTDIHIPTFKEQLDLVEKKLAKKSVNPETGNITFKYTRDVMFKKKWFSEPNTMECRGHTYSPSGELLVLPFRKTFNYGENNHWSDVPDDAEVVMYKKYNGFMAAGSNGVIATTGTTNSDFAKLAKERIESAGYSSLVNIKHTTYLFEIVDESDPHIVKETPGVICIGARSNRTGVIVPVGDGIKCTFGQAKEIAKNDKGEGFMVYRLNKDGSLDQNPCKLKSDYYVNMKKLMRMSDRNVDLMFYGDYSFSGVWRLVVQHIVSKHFGWEWKEMTDQERRTVIEDYLAY